LLSFGESGRPCLVAPAHQLARIRGIVILPEQLHHPALWWRRRSRPQWLSTVCQRHRYRLVLWCPRAHPSWTSRNPSICSCGWDDLSRRQQRQLPRPLPLLTSCRGLQRMARCCRQHTLTSPPPPSCTQCAVSVLDSYSTLPSHSCRAANMLRTSLQTYQEDHVFVGVAKQSTSKQASPPAVQPLHS